MHAYVVALLKRLTSDDYWRLKKSASQASSIEAKYRSRIVEYLESLASQSVSDLIAHGEIRSQIDLVPILVEHAFETTAEAMELAESDKEYFRNPKKQLALPKGKPPRSLKDLMALWDAYRKGQYMPKRQKVLGEKIKTLYIRRVHDLWEKHSEEFRQGREYDQRVAKEAIRKALGSTVARAETIVQTETTRYYNAARRNVYDLSESVTHYLFLAVRDAATTKWCTHKVVQGKRGRSGLVYAKGDPLLIRETPPCHWNCRSEILPLSYLNPVHRKLIEDMGLQRRRNQCHDLPKGWNA